MKGKLKQRLLALVLCVALIATSIGVGNFIDNKFKAATEAVKVSVSNNPKIDVILSSKKTNTDLSSFKEDILKALNNKGIDTSNIVFQTADTITIDSNAADASTIFNNWKRVGYPGQWSLVTIDGITTIQNAENTSAFTGFLYPDGANMQDVDLSMDIRSTHNDDDYIGIMFRFNITQDSSNPEEVKCTTYYLNLSSTYQNGNNEISYLGKINNALFAQTSWIENGTYYDFNANNMCLLTSPKTYGWNSSWNHYDIKIKGNNIKCYRNGVLFIDYTDNNNPIMSGSYGVFSYSQPYAQIRNFKAVSKSYKSFKEILTQPAWREDAKHVVIAVDDYVDDTLTGTNTIGEILSRTMSDDIHFIQWGTNTNKASTTDFINRNDKKGVFTLNTDYNQAVEDTATYIKKLVEQETESQYVIVGQDTNIVVTPSNLKTGATSTDYPNGRWMIHHDYTFYDNNLGQSTQTEVYTPDLICNFDKPGKYNIYFDDELVKEVYAHRLPVADFNIGINSTAVTLTSQSYDLDKNTNNGYGKGIASEEWYYKEATSSAWTSGKLTTFDKSKVYMIKLKVTDMQGASSETVKYVGTGSPVASFNYGSNQISKYSTLVINDTSYDPEGYTITGWQWVLKKNGNTVGTYTTKIPVVNFNTTALGVGEYTYTLTVTNNKGTKSENAYTKAFTVIEDTDKPEVIINPTNCDWKTGTQSVSLTFSDGDSGFKNWRYCFDTTQTMSGTWSAYSTAATATVTTPSTSGQYYLHVQATDVAGNVLNRTVGLYKIDNTNPVISSVTKKLITNKASTMELTINATDAHSGIQTYGISTTNDSSKATWGTASIKTVTENGTYYIFAKDNVGNVSAVSTVSVTELTAAYTVKHYKQNLNDNNYTLSETENFTGPTGSSITIADLKKTYTGFTYKGGKGTTAATATIPSSLDITTTILADGTRVINLYYTRNQYTVTLNKGTGISSVSGAGTYYYGASVTINATVSNGYTWSKWSGTHSTTTQNYTFTMPASNVTDTANTTINNYTLTVNPNAGTWNGSTSNSTFTLNYGTTKTIANPTRTGYTFSKWNVSGSGSSISGTTFTMGYANATLTAQWTANTNTKYVVNHYQMNTDGSTYALKETENLTGTTDSNVTPSVKTYTGFTSPSTQTVKIAADGTTVVNYYYTRNKYTVTYIDVVDSTSGKQLGSSTDSLYYGVTATGSTKGTNSADNYYYNGYYYSSCTTATVGTSGATVYRIFKLRTVDVSGSVNWNDKSNAYSSRPNNVTIYLYRNGQQIDTYTGLTDSDNNSFSFKNLQKYDTSTGAAYTYTVSQSNVESLNNPEDKYTTTVDTTGFNFTNTLDNSTKEDPEPEWVGFEVSGSIVWDDYDDKFGTRPSEITLTLYQNDVAIKTQIVDKTSTGYSFVNLDKYDDNLNPYTYKVEETFTARALTWDSTTKQYEEIDAYTITVDGFDFTNTLVDTKDKPIIEVKPDHNNTLTIKLGFDSNIDWTDIEKSSSDVQVFVTLKQMEMLMDNGTVSYTSNYNGMEYNAIVTETGVSINNIPSGKYEIVESNDNTFILEGIDLQTTSSISVVNENGKWYLIIAETNKNQTGTITLNMNTDSFNGIDSSMMVSNRFSLTQTSPVQVMMLSMFSDEITVPEYVEPITYTITYKDCDVVDDIKYSENSEATLKDCDIENFLGWSEDSEATEPEYMAGDTITMEKDIVLYPVIESLESTEKEPSEETESKEQEESAEIENTSEEKTSKSEESTEDVKTATEEESSETQEESSEAEETETESSETTENEESLEKNSAFSE